MAEKTLRVRTKQSKTESGPAPSVQEERSALDSLGQSLAPFGLSPPQITNLWVALKSKPALLLSGPGEGVRDHLAMDLARTIAGPQADRLLRLQGHPWWAAKARNQVQFIRAQQRLTSLRLRTFLDQAGDSEFDAGLLFAVMLDVSRAELHEYFVDLPRQVSSAGGVVELPLNFAPRPTRYPDQLYWLATFDFRLSGWLDPRLLDAATIVEVGTGPPLEGADLTPRLPSGLKISETLVRNRRFHPNVARALLPNHPHDRDALRPLRCLLAILRKRGLEPPSGLISDGLLYLENAWDVAGDGLFDFDPVANGLLAGEYWLKQSALPRLRGMLRQHQALQLDLRAWLEAEFPKIGAADEPALRSYPQRVAV